MKERGIIFSAPMIRAILAGTKTQTRRLAKSHPLLGSPFGWCLRPDVSAWCPYGAPGDRIWCKETFALIGGVEDVPAQYVYRADGADYSDYETEDGDKFRWRPSIFMPRRASRITLQITDIRVARLQSISEEDARAEGYGTAFGPGMFSRSFSSYWNEINKERCPWSSNPWCWCLTFRRLP